MNDKNKIKLPAQEADLPAGMFRSGDKAEEAVIQMPRRNYGTVNVWINFTEVNGNALFEGDIVLGSPAEVRNLTNAIEKGIVVVGEQYRWPDGNVPYRTEDELKGIVQAAINHWQENTPFIFVPRTNEENHISFERQGGCWSKVGRRGGEQVISLGEGCGLGAAIHEIGHALGLWHEQSRSDRDSYIEIRWENIKETHKHNFDKHVLDGQDLGDYDFGSMMHYPALAFSKNGKPTIVAKGGQPIGQRNGLSTGDISAIQMAYPELKWPD